MTPSSILPSHAARRALGNRSAVAAFLCYHSVTEDGPPYVTVKPETFERQLAALRRRGYAPGHQRALAELAAGLRPKRPRAFLTFDDGFYDTFEQAFPLLQAYAFTALVFVVPPLVDASSLIAWYRETTWPERNARILHSLGWTAWQQRYARVLRSVGWRQVEVMAEAGIEFGSHTSQHPYLTDLGDEQLREELLDSRVRIKERLGRCDTIAYPFGAWSPRVIAAAIDVGYSFGFSLPYSGASVGWQRGATRMSIPRIAIEDRDDERRFGLKLTPAGRRLLLSPAKAGLRAVEPWLDLVRGEASGVDPMRATREPGQ